MASIEEMFAQYLEREAAKDAAEAKKAEDAAKVEAQANFVSKADLEAAFTAFGEQFSATVAEQIEKALPVARPEGAGRVGETTPEDPREADPVAYIAKKAAADRTDEDKALAWALTQAAIKFAE
jgi:hypothetical protein